ncbi:MAG: conserved rane protein of unknown function [Chloroflexi bacterium]|jgi:uncharacterized membrane protein|nr:conserved rane protein of unknown function [Chloroflexota bacterium]
MFMERFDLRKRLSAFPWKSALVLSVGILLLGWLLETPAGLLGKADAIGYAVCHRIDLRSFHINGRPLPLCARCSGMYLGAMLGLVFLSLTSRRRGGLPPRGIQVLLGVFVLAFGIDGLNSFFSLIPGFPTLYQPQNWLRLVTGTGMGLVIAAFLFPAFNQTVWREWDPRPALGSWKLLSGLIALAAVVDLALLSERPLILYPLALISAAGVMVILTMVYSMLWLMAFKRENRYENVVQLGMVLVGGFGTALLQIALLDFVRYFFTGSWGGFHLG